MSCQRVVTYFRCMFAKIVKSKKSCDNRIWTIQAVTWYTWIYFCQWIPVTCTLEGLSCLSINIRDGIREKSWSMYSINWLIISPHFTDWLQHIYRLHNISITHCQMFVDLLSFYFFFHFIIGCFLYKVSFSSFYIITKHGLIVRIILMSPYNDVEKKNSRLCWCYVPRLTEWEWEAVSHNSTQYAMVYTVADPMGGQRGSWPPPPFFEGK